MTDDASDSPFHTGGAIDALKDVDRARLDIIEGRVLGEYRVTGLIAEGGMGRVYRADRIDGSFEREVAIKVSAISNVSDRMHERFQLEQTLLASLNHPNIAQLFDAQVTAEGWPYFVMEYIDGGPIDEYCETGALSLDDRVRLFIDIVDAVAYAHSRLIVHRDIKPTNVLVASDGRAKLLDFGIAKLLENDDVKLSQVVPLTPRYASPEQLLGQPVTIASDVFQLGHLLYQVLAARPLVHDDSIAEAIARARDERSIPVDAEARQILPHELILIIEQCLRPAADDRYRDANALRDDLQAYLDGYPVRAAGQGAGYRFRKFATRNWIPVAALTGLFVVITAALVFSNLQRLRVEKARADLEAVTQFQAQMLQQVDPREMGNRLLKDLESRVSEDRLESFGFAIEGVNLTDVARGVIDRNILAEALNSADVTFSDRPLIAANLEDTIGEAYRHLGLIAKTRAAWEAAYERKRAVLGPDHRETLHIRQGIGALYFDEGDFEQAADIFRETLDKRRALFGDDDPDTLESLSDLGNTYIDLGRNIESEALLEESLRRNERLFGRDHAGTLNVANNLGYLKNVMGDHEEAERLYRMVLDGRRRVLGAANPETLMTMNNLSALLQSQGNLEEARVMSEDTLELKIRVLGREHPSTANSFNSLGNILRDLGEFEEAESVLRESVALARNAFGPAHPRTAFSLSNYAEVLSKLRRFDEAKTYFNEALELAVNALPPRHAGIGVIHGRYGICLTSLGEYDEAERFLESSYQILVVENHSGTTDAERLISGLVELYEAWGRSKKADEWRERLNP